MSVNLLYITAPDKHEAIALAKTLLGEHLIACANISEKVISLYHWQGELEETHEAVIIAKTRSDLVNAVIDRVNELHPYDTPCVVALPVEGVNNAFEQWVNTETRK